MSKRASLLVFLTIVVGGGLLIGTVTLPGQWYAELAKPPFNPPNWVFGPVWTLLYVLIAVAGWRTWVGDARGSAMALWWGQLFLNFLWSPIFFAAHRIGFALVIILSMLTVIITFIAVSWSRDRIAAWLFVPYAAWVAFASMLNAAIWWLN